MRVLVDGGGGKRSIAVRKPLRRELKTVLGMRMQMLETPLSRAVHNGHLQTARHLLDKGADVNCLDIVRTAIVLPSRHPEELIISRTCARPAHCHQPPWLLLLRTRQCSTHAAPPAS